jgi:regulator of ribosome biosynthesis
LYRVPTFLSYENVSAPTTTIETFPQLKAIISHRIIVNYTTMARRKAPIRKSKEEEEEVSSTSASDVAEEGESGEEDRDNDNSDVQSEEEQQDDDDEEEEAGSDDEMNSSDEEEESSAEESEDDESSPNNADDVNAESVAQNEQCTFDLGNLLSFNTHQVNAAELYRGGTNNLNKEWYDVKPPTIEATKATLPNPVNESILLSKAAEGTTQLLRELWKLPTEKTDLGLLAKLPSAETRLPRMLPPPPPKQLTKWEQFALQRGIAPKGKQSRKVFDEATGEWKYLTGSLETKANAGPESWPIIEVKKNDDPMQDPWEKLREEKKSRVSKNTESRMRNAERAGNLEKGSANRMLKNMKKQEKQKVLMRQKERERGLVAPVGVPVDLKSGGERAQRGKPSTQLALKATQVSTASLGRFDKQIEGEPERQLKKNTKKRKLDPSTTGNTNKKYLQTEAQKSQDILSKVMNGSKQKDRDVKKGKYAKGETAYDYDFDDGLGAGSFKKKKGRAGAGKMKKLTKRRIK